MTRRFTLFALIAALCLILAGCGGLFVQQGNFSSGKIVIPLRSAARKADNPLDLCTRFEFTLSSANFNQSSSGTTSIEFSEIPFDTYTLAGTAFGLLSEEEDAEEVIIATCSVTVVIDSEEPQTVSVPFYLSEAALIYFNGYTVTETETNANGDTVTVEITYTGTDKTTKVSETETTDTGTVTREFAIGADGNNVTDNYGNIFISVETTIDTAASGDTITVTEFSLNNGVSEKMKETVTEPGGKVTTSEFSLDETTQGCTKRVTEVDGNTTTVSKYDSNTETNPTDRVVTAVNNAAQTTTITTYDQSEMTNPASVKVIEAAKTTTTEYLSSDKTKTNKVTELITSGTYAGQKTETEFDTTNNRESRIIVTSPDNSKTISELDYSVANTVKTVTYNTDWIPGGGESGSASPGNPDSYNIFKTVEVTPSGTVESTYYYDKMSVKYNEFGTDVAIPYSTITSYMKDANGNETGTSTTSYAYCKGTTADDPAGRPKAVTSATMVNATGIVTTTSTVYTYDEYGRVTSESIYSAEGFISLFEIWKNEDFCSAANKDITNSCTYDYVKMGVYVFGLASPYSTSSGVATTSSSWNTADALFSVTASEENAIRCKNGATVGQAQILQFLKDNYVLCGDTLEEIDWVTDTTKAAAASGNYGYIYKADLEGFARDMGGCFGYTIVGSNIYCVIHNTKSGCGVWNTTKNDRNGTSQKFSTYFIDNNLGLAGNW